jgi:hypothetical protein
MRTRVRAKELGQAPGSAKWLAIGAVILVAAAIAITVWSGAGRVRAQQADRDAGVKNGGPQIYRTYKYRVDFGKGYVAGFSVMNPAAPAPPTKASGGKEFQEISLERGVTQDNTFANWLSSEQREPGLQPKDLTVDVYNTQGEKTASYKLHGCTMMKFDGTPNLDVAAGRVVVNSMEVRCGF